MTEKKDLDEAIARAAVAQQRLAIAAIDVRRAAISATADAIRKSTDKILLANKADLQAGEHLPQPMQDRLKLTASSIEGIAKSLEAIAKQKDPLSGSIETLKPASGLEIRKLPTPIGLVGIIFEARPNVVADASALCILSGNAAILRAGSDSLHSSISLAECVTAGLKQAGLSGDCVFLVPSGARSLVGDMLKHPQISLMVPRGGKSLIERVMQEARMPVLAHREGLCHVYLHKSADPKQAVEITVNAKMRRVEICGAAETLLIDEEAGQDLLSACVEALLEKGCEVRLCEKSMKLLTGASDKLSQNSQAGKIKPATQEDWSSEYLAPIISIKLLAGLEQAIEHINAYGSHHTDAIVAQDALAIKEFVARVESAIVISNASTQFADGGEFGFGAEIGIATGRMPPRGPIGARELTSYFYHVAGRGHTRP